MKSNKNLSSGREAQRTDFVENLYKGLRKKTISALANHEKIISLASNLLRDGLEADECTEFLIIEEGLSREAAGSYVNLVKNQNSESLVSDTNEYSFQFEDENGLILSSYDINRTVQASSEEEAWEKAEEILQTIEAAELIKVTKMS
jgi:hypothetical protein